MVENLSYKGEVDFGYRPLCGQGQHLTGAMLLERGALGNHLFPSWDAVGAALHHFIPGVQKGYRCRSLERLFLCTLFRIATL
jgi:hypothetical protein